MVFSVAYFELESTQFSRANLASAQTEERDMDVDGYEIAYSGALTDSVRLELLTVTWMAKMEPKMPVKFLNKLGLCGWIIRQVPA